jgi:hypothetical protein
VRAHPHSRDLAALTSRLLLELAALARWLMSEK